MPVVRASERYIIIITHISMSVYTLFLINLDGYNRYVEVVGRSVGVGTYASVKRSGKIYKIDDTTKMLHLLSEVKGANDWLYTVIEDIVSI